MTKLVRFGIAAVIPSLLASAYGCVSADDTKPIPLDGGGQDATVPRDSAPPPSGDAGPGDATVTGDAADGAVRLGRVEGVIVNMNQSAATPVRVDGIVPGARVSIGGLPPVTSDGSGHFVIEGVPVGPAVRLSVSKASGPSDPDGRRIVWSSTQVALAVVEGQTTQAYPRLAMGCSTTVAVNAAPDGGEGEGDAGVPVVSELGMEDCAPFGALGGIGFESGGVARQNNEIFVGTMRVERVPIALPLREDAPRLYSGMVALPGEMRGLATGGATVQVDALGAVEYRIYDEATGEELRIAPNRRVHLEIEVHRPPSGAETFPVWSFDPAGGRWVQEGTAEASNNRQIIRFAASHLSWWGVGKATTSTGCVRGTVTGAGIPVPLGSVAAVGVTYGGRSFSPLGPNGGFCLDVQTGGRVDLHANSYGISTFFLGGTSGTLTPDAGGSCAQPAACLDVGTVALLPQNRDCLKARFISNNFGDGGVSQTAVPVTTPLGIYANIESPTPPRLSELRVATVTPNANGETCLPLPSSTLSYTITMEGVACPNGFNVPRVNTASFGWVAPDGGGLDAGDAGVVATCGVGGCFEAPQPLNLSCVVEEALRGQ